MLSLKPDLTVVRRHAEASAAAWMRRARTDWDPGPLVSLARQGRALIGADHAAVFLSPEEVDEYSRYCRLYAADHRGPPDHAFVRFKVLGPIGLDAFRTFEPFWGALRCESGLSPDFAWSVDRATRQQIVDLVLAEPLFIIEGNDRRFRVAELSPDAPARPRAVAYAVRRARFGAVFGVDQGLYVLFDESRVLRWEKV